MMDMEQLRLALRARLGDRYTQETALQIEELRRRVAARRYQLSTDAQAGRIDGERLAHEINGVANEMLVDLRRILGENFERVVGAIPEQARVMIADPKVAREIDYRSIPADDVVSPERIERTLQDPMRVDILHNLCDGPLSAGALAARLRREQTLIADRLGGLRDAQLVRARGEEWSVTPRVRKMGAVHIPAHVIVITDDSGEDRYCWLSPSAGVPREDALRLERELSTEWLYSCMSDKGGPGFSEHERGRGGTIKIVAYSNSIGGVDAFIDATREWYTAPDGRRHQLSTGIRWHSKGGVSVRPDGIEFFYTIENETGSARDSYLITDDSVRRLQGTFHQSRADGSTISGMVELVKRNGPELSKGVDSPAQRRSFPQHP